MSQYTLTYSESVQGWVSFYSFIPDWIIGMNNYLYTFKGGNLYRHNVNEDRNTFYGQQYESKITSVFNDSPTENKLFKTLNLEGNDEWEATLVTDIQVSGYISSAWFEKKEQSYFAFVRNMGSVPAADPEYLLRSANGIGRSESVVQPVITAIEVNFPISPLVSIGSIISIGDMVYFSEPPYISTALAGEVVAINVDLPEGINQIVIDGSVFGSQTIPIQDAYFMFIKNSVAESHGVLGHYCKFELTNGSVDHVELFVAESNVMKSYP